MSTAQTTALALPATKRPSLITSMAGKYNIEPAKLLETLKETILPKASDAEMQAFCIVAHEYDLNPFLKEIHAFPNKSGGITPVVGVDGWCSLMNRRPDFDGIEFDIEDQDGKPYSVTASIYIKGRSRPVRVTEYHSECARNTDPWRQSPRRMLRHRALIQAARVAFGFSGIMDEEDAVKLAVVTDVQTVPESKPVFGKIAAPKADAVAATVPEVVKDAAPLNEGAEVEGLLSLLRSHIGRSKPAILEAELCITLAEMEGFTVDENTPSDLAALATRVPASKVRSWVKGWGSVEKLHQQRVTKA